MSALCTPAAQSGHSTRQDRPARLRTPARAGTWVAQRAQLEGYLLLILEHEVELMFLGSDELSVTGNCDTLLGQVIQDLRLAVKGKLVGQDNLPERKLRVNRCSGCDLDARLGSTATQDGGKDEAMMFHRIVDLLIPRKCGVLT